MTAPTTQNDALPPPVDSRRPVIAVTAGDPCGIGPEIVVKALSDKVLRKSARFLVLGPASALEAAADSAGIRAYWWRLHHGSDLLDTASGHDVVVLDYPAAESDSPPPPEAEALPGPTRYGGESSLAFVEDAISMARAPADDARHVHAVVTAPISKEAWNIAARASGRRSFPGHTELFAQRLGARRHAMMFVGPRLRVVLATVHIPLMSVGNALTMGRIVDVIQLGHGACVRMGAAAPRIGVCGLNPHAGEGGLLGDEDERLIEPAVSLTREQGIDAAGPLPADAVFPDAAAGKYDLVVAMYHDQGLIPAKVLDRSESVNLTLGLPVVRTSPAHGTAYGIAGRNAADPASMKSALELAVRLTRQDAARPMR